MFMCMCICVCSASDDDIQYIHTAQNFGLTNYCKAGYARHISTDGADVNNP